MSQYAKLMSARVPQTEPLNDRQVPNNAGGFVFALDDFKRLERFLILGSDSNTYYQTAKALTKENAACVTRCWEQDVGKTARTIANISQEGRAPKNDPAIFALALGVAHKDEKVRAAAYLGVSEVCRTATHLFQLLEMVKALGKGLSSPGMKKVIKRWYMSRSPASVAYQLVKYRQRNGFTHKRALEICGYGAKDQETDIGFLYRNQFNWAKGKEFVYRQLPLLIQQHIEAMKFPDNPVMVASMINRGERGQKLPFEAIPTEVRKDPDVNRALLPDMGATALIRNLGLLTSYGVLKSLSKEAKLAVDKLTDPEFLKKGRIHPFNVLLAKAVYDSGKSTFGGRRGGDAASWEPVGTISSALEEAFYLSFKTIVPSGKRTLIGLDVSGSMSSPLMGSRLQVNEGAAAMAMTVMRTEEQWAVCAFDNGLRKLPLTPKMALRDVLKYTKDINGGGTDCALPMIAAIQQKLDVDVFQIYTDNETYAGYGHPVQMLKEYRQKSGINAKLVVVGMTSTGFTIADPEDPGMLDVVGFDSAASSVIADFARS